MIFIDTVLNTNLILDRLSYLTKTSKEDILNKIPLNKIEEITTSILKNRKFSIDKFNNLNNNFINPYLLKNAKKAADIITSYLKNPNSVILTYNDYDCDGLNAAYILSNVLSSLTKGYIHTTIPERKNGYGINMTYCKNVVNKFKNTNYDILVITADNGISKKEEVKFLKDNGIEVIVTDHHVAEENTVPDCLIVDPHNKLIEQNNIYDHLCGCSVVFKLCQLIKYNFNQDDMMKYTPYVALATIADVMPLTPENISFISYGFEIINSKECPIGLMKLKYKNFIKNVTVGESSWKIIPSINSCSRLNNTYLAYSLLNCTNYTEAEKITDNINELNKKRKELTKKAEEELKKIDFKNNKVCIFITDKYESGILGILAGRLSNLNERIAIVTKIDNKGICSGSVRSYKNVDILSLLHKMKEIGLIISCGGHSVSCAVSFYRNKLELINIFLNHYIDYPEENEKIPEQLIDGAITFDDLNEYFYDLINLFPCDNKTYQNPVFKMENLKVLSYENKQKSIKLNFENDKSIFLWGEQMQKYITVLKYKNSITIIGEIKKIYKNYTINVIDIY